MMERDRERGIEKEIEKDRERGAEKERERGGTEKKRGRKTQSEWDIASPHTLLSW